MPGNRDGSFDASSAPALPVVRWVALTLLLLAEILGLSVRFEFLDAAGADPPWWTAVLAQSHAILSVLLFTVAGGLFLGAARLRDEYRRQLRDARGPQRFWPFLLVHLGALAAFAWLTSVVCERGFETSPHAAGWLIAWLVAGLATFAAWAAMAVPPAFWLPLARRGWSAMTVAAGIDAAAWWAGLYTRELWRPLHALTFRVVRSLLNLVLPQTVSQTAGFRVGTPEFSVGIDRACSGYEGIGLICVFLVAYLWYARRELRFPRALLLLPLGTLVIWLANALRIALLVIIGVWFSPRVALGGFHSQAGWLAFVAISLGLVAVTQRWSFFQAAQAGGETGAKRNPAAPYLAPLLAIFGTAMICGAFSSSSGFDRFYAARVLAAAGVLWCFRRTYAAWRWTWNWPALAIGVLAFGLWMALEFAAPQSASSGSEDVLAAGLLSMPREWAAVWLVFRIVGAVVTVPLAEELAFRGYLLRRLVATDFEPVPYDRFTWVSFLASSVLFGLVHGRWLAGTLAGMLYAVAVYRRGRLSDAVLAHATTNALIAAYVVTSGNWSLWQ